MQFSGAGFGQQQQQQQQQQQASSSESSGTGKGAVEVMERMLKVRHHDWHPCMLSHFVIHPVTCSLCWAFLSLSVRSSP